MNVSDGNPDAARAASAALGPGTGSMRMPASIAARMSRSPGSDTVGVPASDTRATLSPWRNRARSTSVFRVSLCSCRLVVGVVMA